MKKFWIGLLGFLMNFAGVTSFCFYYDLLNKTIWANLLLLPILVFLIIPALNSWERYFNELFKSDKNE